MIMDTDTGTGTKTRAAIMDIATVPNQSCESYSVLLQANTDGGSLEASASELQAGGTAPATLNAANEVAVRFFLDESIGFLDICGIVADVLAEMPTTGLDSMDTVYEIDSQARALAEQLAKRLAGNK